MRRLTHTTKVALPHSHHQARYFFGPLKDAWNNAKQRYAAAQELAKMSAQLQKEAAGNNANAGGNQSTPNTWGGAGSPLTSRLENMTEAQIQQMKSLLAQTKNAPANTTMGKFVHSNRAKLEEMVENHEKKFKALQAQKKAALKQGDTAKASSTPSSSSTKASTQGGPSLSPEVEAMFDELRQMREKKNKYKTQLDEKIRAMEGVSSDLKRTQDKEKDLRSRLATAEKTISLMQTETVELKDKIREGKAVQKQLQELKAKYNPLLRADGGAAASKSLQETKLQLSAQTDEVDRLNRKLRRLQRSSPLAQLSSFLGDLRSVINREEESKEVDAEISLFRDEYENHVMRDWNPVSVRLGLTRLLVTVCRDFYRHQLPNSLLDAKLQITGDVNVFKAAFVGSGFDVRQGETDTWEVVGRTGSTPLLGPFGLGAALVHWQSCAEENTEFKYKVVSCVPFISPQLLANENRTSIDMHHSRSSKPGGQASNVGETKVTAALVIDGTKFTTAVAQDTRSTMNNRTIAKERLTDESLALLNKHLSQSPASATTFSHMFSTSNDKSRFGSHMLEQWTTLCSDAVDVMDKSTDALDTINAAVVKSVRHGSTTSP